MPDTTKVQLHAGGIPMVVLQVILPILMAIIAGYGAVKYTSGETTQQLNELTRRSEWNRDQIEKIRANSVSREEMRLFIEQARADLAEIKADIRAMRDKR